MDDQTLINGLLAKRDELQRELADLNEKVAIVSNDIEALHRVLDSCGYRGELVNQTPRAARVAIFYRNELREFLLGELRGSDRPLTARELACRVCQVEGKNAQDRRMLNDITRRVGNAMRRMRALRMVEGERSEAGTVWRLYQ